MTEKQLPLEIAHSAEQTTNERPRVDRSAVNPRQERNVASSTPQSLISDPYQFSRIEIGPELQKAVSYGQLWRLELEAFRDTLPPTRPFSAAARAASLPRDSSGAATPPNGPVSPPDAASEADRAPLIAKPKSWLGVVIACLLGAVPVVLLGLARCQGNAQEVPATPTEVIETAAAPTQGIDLPAPASVLPKLAIVEAEPAVVEAEPAVVSAPRSSRVVPAATAQIARTKSTAAPTNSSPAPVRSSWFHR